MKAENEDYDGHCAIGDWMQIAACTNGTSVVTGRYQAISPAAARRYVNVAP